MADNPKIKDNDTSEAGIYDYAIPEKPKNDHRKSRRFSVPQERDSGRFWGGVVLIGLGIIFLAQEIGIAINFFDNWWALFILVPGIGMLVRIWTQYQQTGEIADDDRGQAMGGVMMILVGSIFLFGLDWSKVWPLFLIIPGLGLLFGWIGDDDE